MHKARLFIASSVLLALGSCNAIMSNMDTFKGLAGQVASSVTGLGDIASKVGLGGTMLADAKSAIEKATGTLGGLHDKMSALAKPDQAIRDMLQQKLSGPITTTTGSLEDAAMREPQIASTAQGAIDMLSKFKSFF
ncbi:MAG: hypothetical protein KDC95_01375 [Planctomycetes bacterium]|nr:hypothetical protein [Planctomycetota bacterium]